MRLGVLKYWMLRLWLSPHHLHTDASRGILASKVVTSCSRSGPRRRGLTHSMTNLFLNLVVNLVLCRYELLCVWTTVDLVEHVLRWAGGQWTWCDECFTCVFVVCIVMLMMSLMLWIWWNCVFIVYLFWISPISLHKSHHLVWCDLCRL
jgi:hypothetical protein